MILLYINVKIKVMIKNHSIKFMIENKIIFMILLYCKLIIKENFGNV